MNDFRTMFPGLNADLIESVLRANNGAVDHTIDQLLNMTLEDGSSTVSFSCRIFTTITNWEKRRFSR